MEADVSKSQPTVTLSLTVQGGAQALEFYQRALGAELVFQMPGKDGEVLHAQMRIGNTAIFLSDEAEEWHAKAMPKGSMASCLFTIMTEDCDRDFEKAAEAGAKPLSPPENQFWGERTAMVLDPYGYRWTFGQTVEEVSPEELERRMKDLMDSGEA